MGFLDKAKQRAQEAQRKLEESGAIDKAKHAAQQAQQKLDEKQNQFNQGQGGQQQPGGTPVRYDKHGRPIQDETPAGATPPPSGEPAAPSAGGPPPTAAPPPPASPATTAPPGGTEPAPAGAAPPAEHAETAERPNEDSPSDETANATPDPFRPIQ
jgi:hypothetical protein